MKIVGFTYVRNGFTMAYPFMASIQSLLPIVDKLIVVVGDSNDGTREAIVNLQNEKIIIVDSIWDEEQRINGSIFRDQANIGLDHAKDADWAIHIQADEVIHESAHEEFLNYIRLADTHEEVDGLLFPFYHFWGDYDHIRNTRRTHPFEIRAFKTGRNIRSYKDSQGFRVFDPSNSEDKGIKLNVIKTAIPFYHYSYTRNPKLMKKKSNFFHRFWHNDEWLKENTDKLSFDFNDVDKLEVFTQTHPIFMKETIENQDWDFDYDPSKSNMSLKDKFLNKFEELFNHRLFDYENYKIKRIKK